MMAIFSPPEARMAKVIVFNSVTLDGYFTDAAGDMSWAHKNDPEWNEFTAGNAKGDSTLLFGRKTYEMMAGFWPSAQAKQIFPEVAASMNKQAKVSSRKGSPKGEGKNTRAAQGTPP